MSTNKKNMCVPGSGFLFTPDGLSLEEMAAKLHEEGYLTDEEMREGGGVPALRRKLYDATSQNRHHYSKHRKPDADSTDAERRARARDAKLAREMNAYADALGVNDPKYMDMIIEPEDLEAFGIEVTGRNLVEAELVAKAMRGDPLVLEKLQSRQSRPVPKIVEMVRWILADRVWSNPHRKA